MKLRYPSNALFWTFLSPVSTNARQRRMRAFEARLPLTEGMRILDLGGHPQIWQGVDRRLDITILNLPGAAPRDARSHHQLTFVEGDGCRVDMFEDKAFDLVFSNSVIEHVGPPERQVAFAREVRRLGKSYWVQTPAIWFPIEAHCGMPFWWFYPDFVQERLIASWRRKLPAWTAMIEGTRVLSLATLKELFPEGSVYVERVAGIPKSYCLYSAA